MSDVVFILGAGASKECGGPLMNDFLDEARRLYAKQRIPNECRPHFENVFQAIGCLQRVHSKAQLDLRNIESVFTALEMASVIQKLPGYDAPDIPKVIDSLKELIVATLERTIGFPGQGTSFRSPANYDAFVELLRFLRSKAQKSVAVITFNYDIGLDAALHHSRTTVDYCLANDTPHLVVGALPVMKLHGSLNWGVGEGDEQLHIVSLADYFSVYSYSPIFRDEQTTRRIDIGTNLRKAQNALKRPPIRSQPFIVPPTWNKSGYQSRLAPVWVKAAHHLSEATEIYVLGYSLPPTDQLFPLLYALGSVGDRPFARFAVHNPDSSGETETRFRTMLGPGASARFEYVAETFTSAVGRIKSTYERAEAA